MARNYEPVELSLVHFHTTTRAYLVGDSGNRDKAVWLAASLVEVDDEGQPTGYEDETIEGLKTGRKMPIRLFTLPEWLANERGLL